MLSVLRANHTGAHCKAVHPCGCFAASPCYTPFMPEPRDVPDEPPPFLGSWKRVYIAVLLYLGAIILGFYVFTRAYR